MSNLKLVPLPRTKFCRKPRNFEKNKTFKEKTYTFTKIYSLLQNKIKEYASSPEKLVKNLELSQYKYTPDAILTHKGIYPYEYMDSFERFPPKGKFYSTLSEYSEYYR